MLLSSWVAAGKGAARILISTFPKDQLMEIARYLAAAAR
jgi:hypothetical protein